jgi:hypothetical protein
MLTGLKRKVIRIKAEDSPNVRLALAEVAKGVEPSGRIIVPGVKQYWEYKTNRRDWDAHQQCVSLDADWYEGGDILMYPAEWLNRAESLADELRAKKVHRSAKAMGVDPGEGLAETALAVVDELGLIELEARKTPDTSDIPGWIIAKAAKHGVPPDRIMFDRGGGGLQHACTLRKQGYPVRTVPFGATITPDKRMRGVVTPFKERLAKEEERYTYKNRRAQMYHTLRLLLEEGYAVPREYVELRRQLTPIPLWYDDEGRIYLPRKHLRPDEKDNDKSTMEKLLGCSPDQADAFVLGIFGMFLKTGGFKVKSMI